MTAQSAGSRSTLIATNSGDGTGVKGISTSGYGGSFQGGAAALRLVPTAFTGAPASDEHAIDELVVDANGALFICVATGTPGTWKQVRIA